jgi:hypothetical protein
MEKTYDRAAEDIGNIVHLEHVNVTIPDQRLSTLFYITGLGLTRDPFINVSDNNMWVNVGRSQFHLPTADPQVLRGHTGIVMPGRAALLERLAGVRKKLDGTRFGFSEHNDYVEATCPWGNRFRCYEPDSKRFGRIVLGFGYVEFDVPASTAEGIAKFYRELFDAPATVENGDGTVARIKTGNDQYLQFRETDRALADFDEHHIAVYIVDFSGPHRRLTERNLLSREDNQYQFRFRDIVDPDSGRHLYTIEHEVRSMTHPMFLRPLVNRNPQQTARAYSPGHDSMSWAMAPEHFDDQVSRALT